MLGEAAPNGIAYGVPLGALDDPAGVHAGLDGSRELAAGSGLLLANRVGRPEGVERVWFLLARTRECVSTLLLICICICMVMLW